MKLKIMIPNRIYRRMRLHWVHNEYGDNWRELISFKDVKIKFKKHLNKIIEERLNRQHGYYE
ncbi:MAG: hypothetical protein ACFFFT_18040 [Candidatus Thorarchaeota archaeon]